MGLLTIILFIIWLVGVAALAGASVYTFQTDESEETERIRDAFDARPVSFSLILIVLILAWPATVTYSLATRRN